VNGSLIFTPDWEDDYTEQRLREELIHFEFKGEGWYLTNDETMFIAHICRRTDGRHMYRVYAWDRKSVGVAPGNPCAIFNAVVNAPVRVDTRV
jgi:hypothetical protein